MNGVRVGSLGDIPLYVSPWFLVLAAYVGLMMGDVSLGGLWVLCLTLSLVVHELGHALVARRLRLEPRILLHGFGGLCAHDRAESDAHDVAIIAAGPGAGLLLGALAFGVSEALPHVAPGALSNPLLVTGLAWMVWLNVFWSLVNLVPIWPLDGGQLFRLGMLRVTTPLRAERITHGVGIALAVGAVGAAGHFGFGRFAMLLAGLIAWENYRALRGERASGPIRSRGRFARGLAAQARQAFDAGDYDLAGRLCHQLRSEPRVPAAVLEECWRLLGLSTARSGRPKEAISYLRRAPFDAEVGEEWLRALVVADRRAEIEELLASRQWRSLGARGQEIVDRIAAE